MHRKVNSSRSVNCGGSTALRMSTPGGAKIYPAGRVELSVACVHPLGHDEDPSWPNLVKGTQALTETSVATEQDGQLL